MNVLRFEPRLCDAGGAVGKFCARSIRLPGAAELVYLPFVMFQYSIETRGDSGKKNQNENYSKS